MSNVAATIGHSIVIQSFTQIVKQNLNTNLNDILFETRNEMSAILEMDEKNGISAIVMSTDSTMPYQITFASAKHVCYYKTKMGQSLQEMVRFLFLCLLGLTILSFCCNL